MAIFQSKLTILILSALFLGGLFLIPDSQEIVIDGSNVSYFEDQGAGGQSQLQLLSPGPELKYQYQIRPGLEFPYVGVTLSQRDSLGQCANWNQVQAISYTLYSEKESNMALDIKTWDEGRTQLNDELSYRILRKEVRVLEGLNQWTFDIESFHIPDWLRKLQKLPNNDDRKILDQVCLLDFAHGDLGTPDNLVRIQAIEIHFDHLQYKMTLIVAYLILMVLLLWNIKNSKLKQRIEEKLTQNREKAKAEIRELETPSEWPKVVEWMKEHFEDADLSLDRAALGIGLSSNKLTQLIKSQTGHSFKAFLNDLRMERACQLLKETDEQVLQVALQCGYNTVAHFNRLFKERYGQTPTQWRKGV